MTEYRAYLVGADGHFQGFKVITAADDEAAVEVASQYVDPGGIVSEPMLLPDVEAARQEARGTLVDFARNIAALIEVNAHWSVDVLSEEGRPLYRIKVVVEIGLNTDCG